MPNPYTRDAILQHMIDWFTYHYESVEENTPRDSGEWVYIWGDPVESAEELSAEFGHLFTTELIAEASVKLDEYDVEWVPVPQDDCEEEEEPADETER